MKLKVLKYKLTRAIFKSNIEGHSYIGEIGLKYYSNNSIKWEEALKVIEENPDTFILIDNTKIFLKIIYKQEKAIAKKIQERLLEPINNEEISIVKDESIQLSKNQEKAVKNACKYNFTVITGGAGSGKSTVSKAVFQTLKQTHPDIKLISPSGAASKRLSQVIGEEAYTVHKLLGHNTKRTTNNDMIEADAVIIDEISMIDANIFLTLLNRIETKTKIIIVGDKNQLPSVEPGEILYQLLESLPKEQITTLDKIFRVSEENPLADFQTKILEGNLKIDKNLFSKEIDYSKTLNIVYYNKRELNNTIKKVFNENKNSVILTNRRKNIAKKENSDRLNKRTQNIIHKTKIIKNTDKKYRLGNRIMYLINDYDKNIFNGTQGNIIKQINDNEVIIKFDNNKVRIFTIKELMNKDIFSLSYAITIHKSQGQEFQNVIIAINDHEFLNREIFYTGITRSKKNLIIFTTPAVLERSNKQREYIIIKDKVYNIKKNTYIKELIKL